MSERAITAQLKHLSAPAEGAAACIRDGMTIAMSGYAMAGYPKAVPAELVRRKEGGEALSLQLITGANVPWLDELLGSAGIVSRRVPMCASRTLAKQINSGDVHYVEQQMHKMPRLLRDGHFGRIDVAVVEALGFTDDGELVPTSSIGMVHHLMQAAERIVIEVNAAQPEILGNLHDVWIPPVFPHTEPVPLVHPGQRIGTGSVPVDMRKVCCIVETDIPEKLDMQSRGTSETAGIVGNLFNFLETEARGRENRLPPVQIGFGGIAYAVADAFRDSGFRDLSFFCGGTTEPVLELLASGKAAAVSTGGVGMSARVTEILTTTPGLRERLVIRNGDITNNPEVISRLGLLALNSGIEVDIYGNVNSSHITGSRVVNGIGGGADFAHNAGLSVILIPSTAKRGGISNIVPMVSHQDISEHDVDAVITEHGVADLRGLDDGERADAIISRCTAGGYREQLSAYLSAARRECGGHHPQLPEQAFAWYRRLKEHGSMLEEQYG